MDGFAGVTLLERMAVLVGDWQGRASALDADSAFPGEEIAALREIGAMLAPMPRRLGGQGYGTEPEGAAGLLDLLRLIGRGNLSVGRIFEGHVNALKLVVIYGTAVQAEAAARDAASGHLFAIWNTEPAEGLHIDGGVLRGRKIVCSAAGHATRAVVTALQNGQPRMLLLPLQPGEHAGAETWPMQGMRACGTGSMIFDGVPVAATMLIGEPGDYLRQPEFSAGAWRTSAVTLGGLEALLAEARTQLAARGRDNNPHQRARIGEALIAQETALLWLQKAAAIAEGGATVAGDVSAYVNLVRLAVEDACLRALPLVQRSLGLAGFQRSNPVERMMRDLSTYLRQPAPDETLDEAAAWFMQRALPGSEPDARR